MIIKCGKSKFDVIICNSLFSHFLGLMFRKILNDGLLFIFERERNVSLHMFFVFYKIDIIYFNDKMKVIKILRNIKPFTPHIKAVKCKYILEVKDYKNIKINDILSVSSK